MTDHRGPQLRGAPTNEAWRRKRRVAAAAATGFALFAGVSVIALGGYAIAIGGGFKPLTVDAPAPSASGSGSGSGHARAPAEYTRGDYEPSSPERRLVRRASSGGGSAHGGGLPYGTLMCVRLCDGFYFPSVSTVGGEAACAAQCPDAPVALYSQPAGSDSIEDAISMTGARYSALPVALRHETTFDHTCTCHRDLDQSRGAELLRDPTFRKGDLVMTPSGFKVYEGPGGAVSPRDFVALSRAPSLAKDTRDSLAAMERAGDWNRQSSGYRASIATNEATPDAAPPRLKGMVTIDDTPSPAPAR